MKRIVLASIALVGSTFLVNFGEAGEKSTAPIRHALLQQTDSVQAGGAATIEPVRNRYYRGYNYGRNYYRPYYGSYRPYYGSYNYGYYRPYYRSYNYGSYRPYYGYGYRSPYYYGARPGVYWGYRF